MTKDASVLNKLYFGKVTDHFGDGSFSKAYGFLSDYQKENSLLVSPQTINGFISLDVDLPEGDRGSTSSKYVVLKLLETSKIYSTYPRVK